MTIADLCLAHSSVEFRARLTRYRAALEIDSEGRSWLPVRRMPSDEHRLDFERRRDELVDALHPAKDPPSMKVIVARVARMFCRFPASMKGDVAAITAVYAHDLSAFPLWAIDRAINRIVKGVDLPTSSSAFAPSSIELQAVCREILQPYRREAADLDLVLNAKPKHEVSGDDKARISAGFKDLQKRLSGPSRG